jgi:hypothetical protein
MAAVVADAVVDDSFWPNTLWAPCAYDRVLTNLSGVILYRFSRPIAKVFRFQSDQGDFNESQPRR